MNKELQFLRVLVMLLICQVLVAQTPTPPVGEKWVPVPELTDEFEGDEIDDTKWDDLHPNWTGRPPSRYKRENTTVGGGYLRLKSTLLKDPSTVENPLKDIWVNAASCVSKNHSAAPGYYYEAKIKASSLSMTSAFWFRVGKYSEIDVIEHIGNPSRDSRQADLPYEFNANTHYYGPHKGLSPKKNVWKMPVRGRDDFHVYAVWWKSPTQLIFYWDGMEVMQIEPRVPYEENLKLIFDTEVFPFAQAGIPNIGLPKVENLNNDSMNTMLVDWVRTYKLEPTGGTAIVDDIELMNPALELETKTSYDVDVTYSTADTNKEVLVSFWKGKDWLGAGTADVVPGENKVQKVTINLANAPVLGTDYGYKFHIRPKGTNFSQATDNGEFFGVEVKAAGTLSSKSFSFKKFDVFKNSDSNKLYVKGLNGGEKLMIYDFTGKKLSELTTVLENDVVNVDISSLSTGVYFIKINGYKGQTFVKE